MRDRAEKKIWEDFQGWCRGRRLKPLPAHPWTLAAYARWCETRHRMPTIVRRLEVIGKVHRARGLEPPDAAPLVNRTLRMIDLHRKQKSRRKGLFEEKDFLEASKPAAPEPSPKPSKGLSATPKLVRRKKTTEA